MFSKLQEIVQDSTQVAGSAVADTLSFFEGGFTEPEAWYNLGTRSVSILAIIVISWLIIRIADKGSKGWIKRFEDLPLIHPRRQRAYTVRSLLVSSTRYIVWPLAFITVLDELEVDVAALIATAGIAGIAIGFGAQSLVKDVINGVLLLFDDTIHVGDIVRIGSEEGIVENIGVRVIRVRRFNGELLVIPAGELRIFGNRSIEFARVIVNVGTSYAQDTEYIMGVMERVANEWAEDHKEILKEDAPIVQAITDFAESSVNARIVVMVVPGEQFDAEREIRRRLKRAFDQEGIEIPFPQRTLHVKGSGPAGLDQAAPESR